VCDFVHVALTRTSGQGRPKGVPNKLTQQVREAFAVAFELMQEDDQTNLLAWAKRNPSDFYKLCQRFVPAQIDANVKGSLTVLTGVPKLENVDELV
jgi:hypothetical protein